MMLAPRAVKRKISAKATHSAEVSNAASTSAAAEGASTGEASSGGINVEQAVDSPASDGKDTEVIGQSAGIAENKIDTEEATAIASTSESQHGGEKDKKNRKEQERLNLLRFTVEECLSDWGLSCLHPELLQILKDSTTGYVYISSLVSLPALASQKPTITDITAAFTTEVSDILELDETGFQIRRRSPPDYDELGKLPAEAWAERTLYFENIPKPPKGHSFTLVTLRAFLSTLLDTTIDAVRLPPFYVHKPRDGSNPDQTAEADEPGDGSKTDQTHQSTPMASLQFDAPLSDTGKALHQYAIPRNGGPFKGFAFVVVNDGEKARRAQDEWSWSSKGKRVITEEEEEIDKAEDKEDSVSEGSEITEEDTFDQEGSNFVEPEASTSAQALGSQQEQDVSHGVDAASSTPSRNPQQLARRSGLCVMPVERFNQLRLEYLRYSRDIAALKERHEALHDNSFSRRAQRRSASPNPSRNRRRSPSPEKWERKPRSPSPDRWERKPLSPQPNDRRTRRYDDTNDDDYPRGCVCFVKRFHPDARGGVLKTLFQAILELEEVCPKDYLQHVDHKRNVDSCHVRFKDAATASFFASYFSGNPKYSHVDPNSTDPNEAFAAVRKGETIRPMEAEVITGIPEAIYWSTVPKGIRKATSGTAQPTVGAVDVQQRSLDSAPVEAEVGKADTLPDEGTEPNLSRKRSLDSPLQNSVEGVNGDRWPKQPRLETSEGS